MREKYIKEIEMYKMYISYLWALRVHSNLSSFNSSYNLAIRLENYYKDRIRMIESRINNE